MIKNGPKLKRYFDKSGLSQKISIDNNSQPDSNNENFNESDLEEIKENSNNKISDNDNNKP